MAYITAIVLGYFLGCSNLAYFLGRSKGVDLRHHGNTNLGAANATITLGWRVGVLVALHDIAKAVAAVLICRALLPSLPYIGELAGVSCVLGHIFPFFLKFQGGKGFASYLGMTLALNWKFALIMMAIVLIITLLSDYLVIGTVSTMVIVPVYMGIATQSLVTALILCVASAVILYKHRANYPRILNGTEIGLRRTLTKKDRVSK